MKKEGIYYLVKKGLTYPKVTSESFRVLFICLLVVSLLQFLVNTITPFICIGICIVLIIYTLTKRNEPYGNVFCLAVGQILFCVIPLVGGFTFLLNVDELSFWTVPTIIFLIFISIVLRTIQIKKRINNNWYKDEKRNNTGVGIGAGVAGLTYMSCRLFLRNINIGNNGAYLIFSFLFIGFALITVFIGEAPIMYWLYYKLSEDEKRKIF